MKKIIQSSKKINKRINKIFKSLTLIDRMLLVGVVVFACAGLVYAESLSPKAKTIHTSNVAQSSQSSDICLSASTCPTPSPSPTPASSPVPQTHASSVSSKTESNSGDSCAQAEAIFGPNFNSSVSSDWSTWSSATYEPVSTINYEYNQEAQAAYAGYVSAMSDYGCSPELPSPAQKEPASDPNDETPAPPTCNTTLEVDYENSYNDQYQSDAEQTQNQIQSLEAELDAAGAGGSSALQTGETELENQFNGEVASLKSTLDSNLATIDCSS